VHRRRSGDGDGGGGRVVARAPEDEPVPEHRLVRQWARAVNERDRDTLVELSQRDITLHPLQVGLSGHYVGHDGLRRWIDDMQHLKLLG
jgi:hypothetical protein